MKQMPLIPESYQAKRLTQPTTREYEALGRVRLSQNFILRDFMFSTDGACRGLSNFPEDPDMVIRAGKALCEKVLEPVLAKFGRFAITFGYQSREGLEFSWPKEKREAKGCNSNPHMWDRKSWGDQVYCRVDILPFVVADGLVDRYEFARWCMLNLDIDLLMQWTRSSGYCISISPKPRRIWLEWGELDAPRCTFFMGTEYWRNTYPALPKAERPKFAPSHTGGRMQWGERRR
jgi:hypothetical protein